jgi:hypothetical protein
MRKFALMLALCSGPLALANVSVSAPANGSTVATSVQYVASASTSCGAGVSAIGIYSAPGDLVYSTPGNHLNTELYLNPGTYHTVVQEWDNCGGSSSTPVTIYVGGSAGGQVTISAPAPSSVVSSTVQYVASAHTSCPSGVAAMGIYSAPGKLAYKANGAQINTLVNFSPGIYSTVVQEWDNCGGSSTAPVTINVGGSGGGSGSGGKTFSNLHLSSGWNGSALLPPAYNLCGYCSPSGPQTTFSMAQHISSPSVSGASTKTSIGGQTVYSDGFWNNKLIGDFSTQGLPDTNHTLIPTLHNFTYDVYFFGNNIGASQALEFDINQFVGGYSYIWGHECRIAGGNQWDIWDNPGQKWHATGIPCHPLNNAWNHLIIQVQRTSDNHLLFKSITLNGVTSTLNYYESPTPSSWYGVTINYQQDGNYAQTPYSIWLDKLNFTYQ